MGFDAHRYEVTGTVSLEELPSLNDIDNLSNVGLKILTPTLERWLMANGLGVEHRRERTILDIDAWSKTYPEYANYEWREWDLSAEVPWASLVSPDGKEILLSEGFQFMQEPVIVLRELEIGYMRKPFRHSEQPSRQEGDTIVITVTNFSDKGSQAFDLLRTYDPEGSEDACVDIFDADFIKKLASYSYDPKRFRKEMLPHSNREYVNFNW